MDVQSDPQQFKEIQEYLKAYRLAIADFKKTKPALIDDGAVRAFFENEKNIENYSLNPDMASFIRTAAEVLSGLFRAFLASFNNCSCVWPFN